MAEIERYSGNVQAFGSQSQGTERTVFGDTTQSDTLDANITADFLRGWGIVGVNENPTKQDFNGLAFTLSQLIAYLHQRGIPEWNGSQEYFEGSVVTTLAGVYRLLAGGDGSIDPDTDDGTNWEKAPTRAEIDQRTIYVGSVAELVAITARIDGAHYDVTSYHPGWNVSASRPIGGVGFVWDDDEPKANHTGGTVIDPDKTFPSDWSDSVQVSAWFTAATTGTGCYVAKDVVEVYAEIFGARPGSANATNTKLSTTQAMDVCLAEGLGPVHFLSGEYYLSDFQYEFGATGATNKKGIVGAGANNTVLHFSGVDGSTVFSFTATCFWQEFRDFKAISDSPGNQTFFDSRKSLGGGTPRTELKDFRLDDFKHGVRSYSWISKFEKVVVVNAITGFELSATSTTLISCYAPSCRYPFVLGAELTTDGDPWGTGTDPVFTLDGAYNYSSLINCGTDDARNGAFIIGICRGVDLIGCGQERAQDSVFVFPPIVGDPGNLRGQISIDDFNSGTPSGTFSDIPQARVLRNGVIANVRNYTTEGYSVAAGRTIQWGAGVTDVLIDIQDSTIPTNNVPVGVEKVTIDNSTAGDVGQSWGRQGGFLAPWSTAGVKKYKTTYVDFEGPQRLHLANVGSVNKAYALRAKVDISVANALSPLSDGSKFIGTVHISAVTPDAFNAGAISTIISNDNGNTDVVVTRENSTFNPTGAVTPKDIVLEFADASGSHASGSYYIVDVELITNADFNASTPTAEWKAIYRT